MQPTRVTSQNVCHCLKQVVRPIHGHVWHSPRTYKLKANTDCLGSLISEMPQASLSDTVTGSLSYYFAHRVKVKFAPTYLLAILTEHACHHNSFWASSCDSNHAPATAAATIVSVNMDKFELPNSMSFEGNVVEN